MSGSVDPRGVRKETMLGRILVHKHGKRVPSQRISYSRVSARSMPRVRACPRPLWKEASSRGHFSSSEIHRTASEQGRLHVLSNQRNRIPFDLNSATCRFQRPTPVWASSEARLFIARAGTKDFCTPTPRILGWLTKHWSDSAVFRPRSRRIKKAVERRVLPGVAIRNPVITEGLQKRDEGYFVVHQLRGIIDSLHRTSSTQRMAFYRVVVA